MTLTAQQQTALNNWQKHEPAISRSQTGTPLNLGDELAAAQAGVTPAVVTALKAAATATVVADVSATAAADAVVTAVADAVGDVGSGALANDLKAKYNAAVTLINELKGDLAEARALVNDLKVQFNALANGIDALP